MNANTPDIKAYYRAVITSKKYVICTREETANGGYKWVTKCTNAPKQGAPDVIIETVYRGENLDILKMLLSELDHSYTVCCYYETFEDFLSHYNLSEYQYQRILKLIA